MYDLDIESFIDDRCPTVWNFGPPKPVDETGSQPKDVKPSFKATPTRSESEERRYDGRLKPIDGDLLHKLFRATMMEKERAAEEQRAVAEQERAAYEQKWAAYKQIERSKTAARTRTDGHASNDLAVPKARGGATVLHEQGEAKNSQQVGPTSKGKKSKKQKPTKAPPPDEGPPDQDRPSSKASRGIPAKAPVSDSKQDDEPEELEKQDEEQAGGPKQTKNQGKKQRKKRKQAQDGPAKVTKQGAEALMSGGLPDDHEEAPAMQGEADELPGFVGAFEVRDECVKQQKVRSATKSSLGKLQPTVESVSSSQASKASFKHTSGRSGRQDKASPEVAPTFEAEKAQSFVSWDEVGQGLVGEATVKSASKITSIRTGSKKSFNHDFGEVDEVWDPPQAGRSVSERRSPDVEWRAASNTSSRSRGLEAERVHSHHSDSRRTEVSARSRRPVNGFVQDENVCPQQDQADSGSRASSTKSKGRPAAEPANVADPWTNSHDRTSSRRSAAARSQLTFEEVGEGWVENVQQAPSSRKSTRSQNANQAWDKPESGKGFASKATSQRTFEEVGEEWAQNTPHAQPSRASARSGRSMPFSAIDDRTVSEAFPQSRSNKHTILRVTSKQSSAKTFEETGRGWQGSNGDHSAAHSRGMSPRSRVMTAHNESASPDEEQLNMPGSWRENASLSWHTVATESSVQSLRSSNPVTESDGSGRPVVAARPTFFAGKGWISPHPLSRSPTEWASPPQSRIILPSQAFPQGATLSYEEWKRLQDEGMRRNFSPTESHLTPNAQRMEHRHRFAGWGGHSSDGHRFQDVNTGPSASVSGPGSYRVPYHHSRRAPDGEFIDPTTPPLDFVRPTYPHHDESVQSGTWEEQDEAQYSDRSGRHSRVQTMSEWSHDHSGSKQAHDGSEVVSSHRSRDSGGPSRDHSSQQSSRQTHRRSHHSSHRSKRHSDRESNSTPSKQPSAGWGRFSLGTTVSRPSHRSSRHTNTHSNSTRSYADGKTSTHSFAESRHSTRHGSGHSSRKSSHLRHEHSASAQSEATETGWGQPAHESETSGHRSRRSTPQRSSHHTHDTSRHTSNHSLPQSTTWKQSSRGSGSSSNERVMEVVEEGRNVWSDVPQYDGTVSYRERVQGDVEQSDVSRTPTSQLYMGRYQGAWGTEADAER